jgi:hypothetical protein
MTPTEAREIVRQKCSDISNLNSEEFGKECDWVVEDINRYENVEDKNESDTVVLALAEMMK